MALLRDCDAGIEMGVSAIEQVLDYVQSELMRRALVDCQIRHRQLKEQIEKELCRWGEEGREPGPIAKGMSWIKTNVLLGMSADDKSVAELIMDGCHMGIKSLSRSLDGCPFAEEQARSLCRELIAQEDKLSRELRQFL